MNEIDMNAMYKAFCLAVAVVFALPPTVVAVLDWVDKRNRTVKRK